MMSPEGRGGGRSQAAGVGRCGSYVTAVYWRLLVLSV
jgi:hypothetical protein